MIGVPPVTKAADSQTQLVVLAVPTHARAAAVAQWTQGQEPRQPPTLPAASAESREQPAARSCAGYARRPVVLDTKTLLESVNYNRNLERPIYLYC